MREYKNTGVYLAKGSAIQNALDNKNPKEAEKLFKECTERFEKQYPIAEHRGWFMAMSKGKPIVPIEDRLTKEEMYAADVHVYELEALAFTMKCKLGMQPVRPYMIVSSQLFSVRRRLENVRRDIASFIDKLTYEDRKTVNECPSWRVGAVIR